VQSPPQTLDSAFRLRASCGNELAAEFLGNPAELGLVQRFTGKLLLVNPVNSSSY
jgi:hypothetical protein